MGKKLLGVVLDSVIIVTIASVIYILLSLVIHGHVNW